MGTRLGGNESYATNLIEALAEIDDVNQYTIFVTRREARERFSNRWPNFQVRVTLPHTPFVRIPLTLSAELRRNRVDVLHVQFTSPPFSPCPVVVSIHDLSFEHLPRTFKRRSRMQLHVTVRRSARNAAQVGARQVTFRTRAVRQVTILRLRHRLALELQVVDDGPGVPDEIRDRIFNPLVSGRQGGTGLGLSLAQTFVQYHQGVIEFESRPGRTVFKILLPLI